MVVTDCRVPAAIDCFVSWQARIPTPPKVTDRMERLVLDEFGLHAYGLRPATVDPSSERVTVQWRGSNN
jgi:hypothetical protein